MVVAVMASTARGWSSPRMKPADTILSPFLTTGAYRSRRLPGRASVQYSVHRCLVRPTMMGMFGP